MDNLKSLYSLVILSLFNKKEKKMLVDNNYFDTVMYKFFSNIVAPQISGNQLFNFVARAYLEPSTKTGPNGVELLMPYILYYTPDSNEEPI